MIKLNRIGNKLGLAGLVGILLSAGMVANQVFSEAAIRSANDRAEGQQIIADHSLEANVALRRMQLAVRDMRLARDPAEVQKHQAALAEARARVDKELDVAVGRTVRPENRERLLKIKSLTESYYASASELARTLEAQFAVLKKRNEVSRQWVRAFDALMSSPALKNAANRPQIENALLEADSHLNAVRAAVWRYAGTGEEDQKEIVARRSRGIGDLMQRARSLSTDTGLIAGADELGGLIKAFNAANDEVLRLDGSKMELVNLKTLPVSNEAIGLMGTAVDTAEKLANDAKAAAASELTQANRISFALAVGVIMALVGSIVFTFVGVARPLTLLNGALGRIAGGEHGTEIPGAARGDEVGDIAKTVVVIADNAEKKAREEAEEKARQDEIAAQKRKQDMIRLADDFEGAVGEIIETVSSASTELEASASTLTSTAKRSEELTVAVASASEEASTNVQSVASASEEMASSVNEISRQVQDSAKIAAEAVQQAENTNARISQLAQAANRIGDVVELINNIAGQTNLLALNATIEAARAGEAGRGFAVVASEVKALAEQTAKATGEISQQISGMQAETEQSVAAIKEIGGTIARMSEIASTIASAVEEQGAATQEISRNVQQAAQGTMQVSASISEVQQGATETGSASAQVLSAAQSLSTDSNRLKAAVDRFLSTVRAA
ncbi:MAG TPA: methyl-accepting chemotaxis protein [Bradyrhizobium sp.]|nr:methyl-accepting chemotaxis protein [Bradyrhizobium sp.]